MQKTGMKPEDIKIDPELRDYLTPLSEEEEKQLTGSLILEGCLSPIIVEANTGVILDGHNRYRICKEQNIPFQIKTLQITKKSKQIEFVIINQLSRRNLSKDAFAKLVGDLYNMMKTRSADNPGWQPGESGNPEGKKHDRQNGEHAHKTQSAGDKVAKLAGVSKRTAEREGRLNEKIKQHNIPSGTPRKKAKKIIKEKEAPKISTAAQAEEEEDGKRIVMFSEEEKYPSSEPFILSKKQQHAALAFRVALEGFKKLFQDYDPEDFEGIKCAPWYFFSEWDDEEDLLSDCLDVAAFMNVILDEGIRFQEDRTDEIENQG